MEGIVHLSLSHHLSSLSSVPSPELNLCWWQQHEEGEAIPVLEELTNSLPRGGWGT